jgi:6-pyruvoyltetrahydropterin/6-carboxytetrahydropterin synthase
MYEVTIRQSFSAAHRLKEIGGTCEKLHGHNFIDFKAVKEWTHEILKELDHKYLNELSYFHSLNPSAENVARFIYDRVLEKAKDRHLDVACVTVWESEDTRASYRGTTS